MRTASPKMKLLELEHTQARMTQKPVLRVGVGARALRVLIKNAVGQEGQVRVCKALVCGRGSLARRSGRDGNVTGEVSFLFVVPPRGLCKAPLMEVVREKWKQFMSSSAVGGR